MIGYGLGLTKLQRVGGFGPSLDLNFLTGSMPDGLTFTRASGGGRFNASGVYEWVAADTPRIDYDPVTLACRGLLIEGSRTNLLLRSSELNSAPWAAGASGDAGAIAGSGISPDGLNNAFLLNDDSNAAVKGRVVGAAITSGNTLYTGSIFAKAGTSSVVSVRFGLSGGTVVTGELVVDLSSGSGQWRTSVAGTSFSVRSAGNGWYRISLTITDNNTGNTSVSFELRPAFATTYSPTLNTAATGTALFWGAQVEPGAFASSYIPTTASAVTRAADIVLMTGENFSRWFNPSEGTIAVDFTTHSNGKTSSGGNSFGHLYDIDSAANNADSYTLVQSNAYGPGYSTIVFAGTEQVALSHVTPLGGPAVVRNAMAYKVNDFASVLDGGAVLTDLGGTLPAAPDRITFGSYDGGAGNHNFCHIRRFRYWPTRLADATLQGLTA